MIRYRVFASIALVLALAPVVASVVTTDLFIVAEGETVAEDMYVVSSSGRVEGTIDGDLVISTGDLIISGTVNGDVHAITYGSVRIEAGAVVEGSLRTVTPQVQIDGTVTSDLFVTGFGATVGETGSIGRDVIAFAGSVAIDGSVGRDVRGRSLRTSITGSVGNDVDIAVQDLTIASGASVGGDVLYRSTAEANVASGSVDGQVVQLPAQSNFIFGVILTLANIIGFLAFVVAGIVLLWLFRATGSAAVEAVEKHVIRTFLVGLLVLIGAPIAVLLLAATLVGLPLAIVLLIGMLLAFVFGPVPAVGAFGDVITRRKAGLFGAFVVGAILWRLGIWLIPIVGGLLYLSGLIWGTGGWVLAAWRIRGSRPAEREALPEAMLAKDDDDLPEDWEYPLPPERRQATGNRQQGDAAGPVVAASPVPPAEGSSASTSGGGASSEAEEGQTASVLPGEGLDFRIASLRMELSTEAPSEERPTENQQSTVDSPQSERPNTGEIGAMTDNRQPTTPEDVPDTEYRTPSTPGTDASTEGDDEPDNPGSDTWGLPNR